MLAFPSPPRRDHRPMLTLRGAPALSSFRQQKLLDSLRQINPDIHSLYAEYVHFVEVAEPLSSGERKILEALLHYGPNLPREAQDGSLFLVTPRPGTISPDRKSTRLNSSHVKIS